MVLVTNAFNFLTYGNGKITLVVVTLILFLCLKGDLICTCSTKGLEEEYRI